MRAMMPPSTIGALHPTKPEWMVSKGKHALEEKPKNEPPKPTRLRYDKVTNELLNEQQVAVTEEVKSETVPWAFEEQEALDELWAWKHLVVSGLLAAYAKLNESCTLNDDTMKVVTNAGKMTLISHVFWAAGELILVPKVPGVANVTSKTQKEFQKSNVHIELARACGTADDRVHVLLPAYKIPKKEDPRENPDKWLIIPAWVARRSADSLECNMEVNQIPVNNLCQIGTGKETFQAALSTTVPVFVSTKDIKKGDEVVVYAASLAKGAGAKKATAITWQQALAAAKKNTGK